MLNRVTFIENYLKIIQLNVSDLCAYDNSPRQPQDKQKDYFASTKYITNSKG